MPIDIDSDTWKNVQGRDPLSVHMNDLLRNNEDKAFSIKEIDEYLLEEHHQLFPADLVGDDAVEGATAARQSIIAAILDDWYWRTDVSFEYVPGDDETDAGLYFTWDGAGISPVFEVEDVKDVNPDSPYGKLESRFRGIESDVDDEISELKDRIANAEYRLRELEY